MEIDSFDWAESDSVRWCEELLEQADLVFGDETNSRGFFSPEGRRERAVGLAVALVGLEETERETWERWRKLERLWAETETAARKDIPSECVKRDAEMSETELSRQVKVDVERSTAFFDRHQALDDESREKKRAVLSRIIEQTMCRKDGTEEVRNGVELQYLQGAHELCLVLLEIAGDSTPQEEIVSMCESIFMTRVFVMHSSLSLAVAVHMILAQVSLLIKQFAPEVLKSLVTNTHSASPDFDWSGDGSELHFILPWMVTLFSHSIRKFQKVVQVWNILFAYPPPYLVYFLGAAVVLHFQAHPPSEECSSNDESIEDIPIEQIFSMTLYWLQARPFRSLSDDCHRLLGAHRDAADFSLWFDADGSSIRAFGPESILPPLWSPCLGSESLGGRVGESRSRYFSVRASSIWTARVAEVNLEWRLVKKGMANVPVIDVLTLALLKRIARALSSTLLQRLSQHFKNVLRGTLV